MDLNVSGLASGFDWKSMVDQLTNVERAPQQRMRIEQADIKLKNSAFTALKTQLSALKTRSEELKKKGGGRLDPLEICDDTEALFDNNIQNVPRFAMI